jgi:hypothetical protein
MQPRPSFDRSLLIPIAIGVISILGLGWLLGSGALSRALRPPTSHPSSFPSLAADTRTPSPPATPTQDDATATLTDPESYPIPPVETFPPTETPVTVIPPTPSATPTPSHIQSLPAGKFDDTNPNIDYGLYWRALKNPGTENSYWGTIHASYTVGNEATFRFTGEQVRLGYQRGRNFGTVTVLIDDQPYSFHEQAFDFVWQSPRLSPGDHLVRIIHDSGESINLDYVEVLD